MVITTAPAVLGNMPGKKDISLYAAVAFLGQVPIKVDGSVTAGDYIVPRAVGMAWVYQSHLRRLIRSNGVSLWDSRSNPTRRKV
jgi:hypothetical protein